jgi:Flp pilus assembly pilin Flp
MTKEEFKINGEDLVKKVKELIKEGNIRRITVKNEAGESLVEFPLTVGVVGVALIPALVALGAIAALLTKCTIAIEKDK